MKEDTGSSSVMTTNSTISLSCMEVLTNTPLRTWTQAIWMICHTMGSAGIMLDMLNRAGHPEALTMTHRRSIKKRLTEK